MRPGLMQPHQKECEHWNALLPSRVVSSDDNQTDQPVCSFEYGVMQSHNRMSAGNNDLIRDNHVLYRLLPSCFLLET